MQGRPLWVAAKLNKYVCRTMQFVKDLTATSAAGLDESGREVVKMAAMPASAIALAQVGAAACPCRSAPPKVLLPFPVAAGCW